MRSLLFALSILLCPLIPAHAQISVSIGINLPAYPELVPVPGYPVYYAPRAHTNYFFYDGLYWVYEEDNWYASNWYNGPWEFVRPEEVPLFVLRIPVRYYQRPPVYFRGWNGNAPPHWGEHWGRNWEERRGGWDQWDRRSVPPPAPLPDYQRRYSGDRYPRAPEQQNLIRSEHYRYQPRESVTQQHFGEQGNPGTSRALPQPQPQAPEPRRSLIQREDAFPNQQRQPTRPAPPEFGQPAQRMPLPQPMQPPPPRQSQEPMPQRTQPHGDAGSPRPEPQRDATGQRRMPDQQHMQPDQPQPQQPAPSQSRQPVQQMPPSQTTREQHSESQPSQTGGREQHGERRNDERGQNDR